MLRKVISNIIFGYSIHGEVRKHFSNVCIHFLADLPL